MSEEVLEKGREIKRQVRIDPKEFIMKIVFIVAAVIFVAAVVTICVFIFAQAFPALKEIGLFKFLFGTHWWPTIDEPQFGIAPMIVGSIYVTAGSLIQFANACSASDARKGRRRSRGVSKILLPS